MNRLNDNNPHDVSQKDLQDAEQDSVLIGPLRVDVISDVMCPWCFIGKRRLEQALASMPDVQAEVFWRPFQLDSTIPEGGIARATYLMEKFGDPQGGQMYTRLEEAGAELGLHFNFGAIKLSPNTMNAHRLLRWAQAVGTQSAVKERLFELYFLEGEDIGDPAVLAAVGAANGVEPEVIDRLLAGDADVDSVREEIETAQRMGVQGVPFYIFNSKVAVSGAQPPDVLAQAARHALSQTDTPET
jgi:predicted DsbA family dithiol-disulfide isomerase